MELIAMARYVLSLVVCIALTPNLVAQALPLLSHPERFHWNGEATGLQATAGVLSEKPTFSNVYPGQGLKGPDEKPSMVKLVRPDAAVTGNVTESLSSLGGIAVVLRNASSHPIKLAWTGEESRCGVWDRAGAELASYPQGISALPAPPVLLSLPPGGFLSEYHSLSSAYGVPLLMKPLQPGVYTIRCRWDVVLDEGYDSQLHHHKFNQDLQISAPEVALQVVSRPQASAGLSPNIQAQTGKAFSDEATTTYEDTKYGVRFNYPPSWKSEAMRAGELGGNILPSAEEKPPFQGISLASPVGYFRYRVIPGGDAASCSRTVQWAIDQDDAPPHSEFIGGVPFHAVFFSAPVTGQSFEGTVFWSFRRGNCYLFETDMYTHPTPPDADHALMALRRRVRAEYKDVIRSVRIAH